MNIRYPIYEGVYRILTYQHGNVLFRPGDKINLRHRCGGGLDWWRESIWQIFFG